MRDINGSHPSRSAFLAPLARALEPWSKAALDLGMRAAAGCAILGAGPEGPDADELRAVPMGPWAPPAPTLLGHAEAAELFRSALKERDWFEPRPLLLRCGGGVCAGTMLPDDELAPTWWDLEPCGGGAVWTCEAALDGTEALARAALSALKDGEGAFLVPPSESLSSMERLEAMAKAAERFGPAAAAMAAAVSGDGLWIRRQGRCGGLFHSGGWGEGEPAALLLLHPEPRRCGVGAKP